MQRDQERKGERATEMSKYKLLLYANEKSFRNERNGQFLVFGDRPNIQHKWLKQNYIKTFNHKNVNQRYIEFERKKKKETIVWCDTSIIKKIA